MPTITQVDLLIKNTKTIDFYKTVVGLTPIYPLTVGPLHFHVSKLKSASPGSAGLYHTAFLFESRASLANAIVRLFEEYPKNYEGSADHLVSEAFYCHDPEGNGVELYFDKNSRTWEWKGDQIVMDSLPLDPVRYVQEHAGDSSGKIIIGHIHLRVGDIALAKMFYHTILGLDLTASWHGAAFFSRHKYHHHIGTNSWQSKGANKRTPSLGLHSFTLRLNDSTLLQRLREKNISFVQDDKRIVVQDPWGNVIVIL